MSGCGSYAGTTSRRQANGRAEHPNVTSCCEEEWSLVGCRGDIVRDGRSKDLERYKRHPQPPHIHPSHRSTTHHGSNFHTSPSMLFTTATLLLLSSTTLAAPATLLPRAAQCGQYQSQSSGPYTLYTNGWGFSSGTGSQCSQIDSYSSTAGLAWSTTWSWSGTPNQVKSYTNVETGFTKKQIGTYTSMPTTWKWGYTGTDLRVNGMILPPFPVHSLRLWDM